MNLEIHKSYRRQDPSGRTITCIINSEQKLAYHQDLQANGFTYTQIGGEITDPFSDATIVRVHHTDQDSGCVACQA